MCSTISLIIFFVCPINLPTIPLLSLRFPTTLFASLFCFCWPNCLSNLPHPPPFHCRLVLPICGMLSTYQFFQSPSFAYTSSAIDAITVSTPQNYSVPHVVCFFVLYSEGWSNRRYNELRWVLIYGTRYGISRGSIASYHLLSMWKAYLKTAKH